MKQYTQLTYPILPEIPLLPGSAEARKAVLKGLKTPDEIEQEYCEWKWNRPERDPVETSISAREFLRKTTIEFLANNDGINRVFSPFCLFHALLLMANLCTGDTQKEILQLLGNTDVSELNKKFTSLLINSYFKGGYTILPSASLWFDSTVDVNSKKIAEISQQFFSPMYIGDMKDSSYRKEMACWLNQATGGKMKDMIEAITMPEDIVMALITAMLFQAKWEEKFNRHHSKNGVFHGRGIDCECVYMNMSAWHYVWFGDGFTGLQLPFDEAGSMWFILPDEGTSPETLLQSEYLSNQFPPSWNDKSFQERDVTMSIPRFEVSSSLQMVDGLKNLGVQKVFTDSSETPFMLL